MAAAAVQFYSRFQIGWRRCFSDVSFYQQTKFRSYNSSGSWDITISGFEKQTSAVLEFCFPFEFDHITALYTIGWRGGLVVGRWTCDLVVAGSRPGRDAAAQQTLGKLFTPYCLCHQAV